MDGARSAHRVLVLAWQSSWSMRVHNILLPERKTAAPYNARQRGECREDRGRIAEYAEEGLSSLQSENLCRAASPRSTSRR